MKKNTLSKVLALSLIALSLSTLAHAAPQGTEFYVESQSPQKFDGASSMIPAALQQCAGSLQRIADECPGASADADAIEVLKSSGLNNIYADDAALIASIPETVFTYRVAIQAGAASCARKAVKITQVDSGTAPSVTTTYNCSID